MSYLFCDIKGDAVNTVCSQYAFVDNDYSALMIPGSRREAYVHDVIA